MEQMVVGVARFVLFLSGCHSLKEKRMVVRRIKDRTTAHTNISVAEVGDQDSHQRAVLGLAMVGSDSVMVRGALEKHLEAIAQMHLAPIIEQRVEVTPYGDSFGGEVPFMPDRW